MKEDSKKEKMMGWVIFLFVLAFFIYVLGDLFLIPAALIGWGIWLIFRRKEKSSSVQVTENSDEVTESRESQITGLTLLHLALTYQYQLGKLTTFRFQRLSQQVDKLSADVCGQLEISESEQLRLLDSAWIQLDKQMGGTLGKIPPSIKAFTLSDLDAAPVPSPLTDDTSSQKEDFDLPEIKTASVSPTQLVVDKLESIELPEMPAVSVLSAQVPADEKIQSVGEGDKFSQLPEPVTVSTELLEPVSAETHSTPLSESVSQPPVQSSQPQEPRFLSREFFTQIFMQFLWQNIGWFIAGFCLVSGSIFLVVATTGFYHALAVFIIFCLYTFFLLGGGYQIRRRYPHLETSSQVLLTIGVLLVPLTLTAAVRLIDSSLSNGWLMAVAGLLSFLAVAGFALVVKLASGMIERSLQNEHARLFIGLAALQFAQPLLKLTPDWWWLAGLHLSLLAILGYALWRFTQHWLHSIFVEQRKVAYYTAGTLVYAATVSFVALTWGSQISLPGGYAGLFLMACSGLLLFVDTQVKQWVHKQALLSHFTFVIYALSVLAILLSLSGDSFPPAMLSFFTVTLGLGAVLYGRMMWHYLTLPPLYLLLVCLSGLYSLLILQHFPFHWYFLLSLPGLAGIMRLYRFAEKRDSTALMKVCYQVMTGLSVGLVGWSLFHASPGVVGLLTALIATAGAFWRLKNSVRNVQDLPTKSFFFNLNQTLNGYAVILLATITWVYTPLFLGIDWVYQFGGGLVILAVLWAALGLWKYSENCDAGTSRSAFQRWSVGTSYLENILIQTTLFNSALLSLGLSVILVAMTDIPLYKMEIGGDFFIGLLFVISGILLWLSLSLRVRTLFYIMLVSLAVGGLLLKFQYFPTSSGRGVILLALATGLLLWWLHYRFIYLPAKASTPQPASSLFWWLDYRLVYLPAKASILQDTNSQIPIPNPQFPNFTLLWLLPIQQDTYSSRFDMVKSPLQHAMLLLWVVGLWRLCTPLFELWLMGSSSSVLDLESAYAISIFWGILVTGLLAAQIRRVVLLPLAVFLAMWALFVISPVSDAIWLPLLSAAYALLIWLGSLLLKLLQPPVAFFLGWQAGYGVKGGHVSAEAMVHWTVLVICLLSVGLAVFEERGVLYATLGIVLLFFGLAGLRYRLQLHSYLVIGSIGLAGLILSGSLLGVSIVFLLEAESITLLLTLLVIGIALLAQAFVAYPTWQCLYKQPLYNTAGFVYVWALFNGLFLFFNGLPIWLPLVFVLLAVGLLPLLRGFDIKGPWIPASAGMTSVRGVGIALLLSMAFVSGFGGAELQQGRLSPLVPLAWLGWGYVLWGVSHFGLPRWNARWRQWAIGPSFWLILGFVFVFSGFLMDVALFEAVRWPILLMVTVYLFLLFGDVEWEWLPWLVVLALMGSGLSGLMSGLWPVESEVVSLPFVIGMGVWAHVLLLLRERVMESKVPKLKLWTPISLWTPMKIGQLERPLWFLPLLLLGGGLFILLSQLQPDMPDWTVLLTITLYLFLLYRHVDWGWLPWLAVLGVMGSGVMVLVTLFLRTAAEEWILYGSVLWASLLLFLSSRLQRGEKAAGEK